MADVRFHDRAPDGPVLTDYDRFQARTYLRLLDAATDKADWHEVVQTLFGLNASIEPERALTVYETHLARARWVAAQGYTELVWGKACKP